MSHAWPTRGSRLGIGTGLTHAKPPAGLVKACEVHELNLFEVPRKATFVAVSRRTAQLLEQQQAEAARDALKIQRRLTSAAAKPHATRTIIETLAHVLSGAVCLLSADGQVLLELTKHGTGDVLGIESIGLAIHATRHPVRPIHLDVAFSGRDKCPGQRGAEEPVLSTPTARSGPNVRIHESKAAYPL
jgi:hypothetical protein